MRKRPTVFGTTTKADGDFHVDCLPERLDDVRALADLPDAAVVWLEQVHGDRVVTVGPGDRGGLGQGDALITDRRDAILTVRTADCVPVFLFSDRAVGMVHAGRGGTVAGIVPRTIAALRDQFEVAPNTLTAALGPHICVDHYPLDPARLRELTASADADRYLEEQDGRQHFSMRRMLTDQLRAAGVTRITASEVCSLESPDHYSHRRGDRGRVVSFIRRDSGA